jgi:hypothetical protein
MLSFSYTCIYSDTSCTASKQLDSFSNFAKSRWDGKYACSIQCCRKDLNGEGEATAFIYYKSYCSLGCYRKIYKCNQILAILDIQLHNLGMQLLIYSLPPLCSDFIPHEYAPLIWHTIFYIEIVRSYYTLAKYRSTGAGKICYSSNFNKISPHSGLSSACSESVFELPCVYVILTKWNTHFLYSSSLLSN